VPNEPEFMTHKCHRVSGRVRECLREGVNDHRIGGRRLHLGVRRPYVSGQTGQVPGLGSSILDAPPTGTPGNVTKMM
jgi:hypothetical protein